MAPDEFLAVTDDGEIRFRPHEDQTRAWDSEARFVAVLAGTQGGKTCFGPVWLHREIKRKGAGDYMVVSPTFPLLSRKALPEFKRLFEDRLALGKYLKADKVFEVSKAGERALWGEEKDTKTIVYFGYAENPESLESATAKAAWLDEAGQKAFRLESWEAVLRRLSLNMGRALITTTWYNLGWLKTKIWDPWKKGDPTIDVIRFESIANPIFPREEWERARKDLPPWKFDLFYRAIPTRPAGLIYEAFTEDFVVPDFTIPETWDRYLGLDFGGVNTVGLFYAREPATGRLYVYREYGPAGGVTAERHVEKLMDGEHLPREVRGGSKSEDNWRLEFRKAGLPVKGPKVADVEVGIDRVIGFHQREEVYVFESCVGYLTEKRSYARELDKNSEPTEKIEDKEAFHFMDAERYILGAIAPDRASRPAAAVSVTRTSPWSV